MENVVSGGFNREVFYEALKPIRISALSLSEDQPLIPTTPSLSTITDLNQIGDELSNLTVDQVIECLKLLNLDQYEKNFRDNHIDGAFLKQIDAKDCVNDLGLGKVEAKRLVMFIGGWRPK